MNLLDTLLDPSGSIIYLNQEEESKLTICKLLAVYLGREIGRKGVMKYSDDS